MNYEPGQIGGDDRLALPDYGERPSRRRWVLGALIVLVLFFPKGIMGTLRKKWLGWLP